MEEPSEIAEWTKISVLGSGGFGTVVLWKNKETNEFIAIKKCRFQKVNSVTPKQRKRWENEVQIMKFINHPNVINFKPIPKELESGLLKYNPSKLPILSMEYCTKGSLRHILREPKNICGLQEQDIRHILEDISSGLNYLHTLNITHRDIKPDNIVLQHCDKRPGNSVYKIIDLGYAKELDHSIVSFVGTLHYIAPEIFLTQQYNKSVDYWSLGILAFEILCGVLPFLPHLGPFERFKKIKEKGPDDICIYLSHAGSVTYSAEIKKESHISYCFKQNIETWLRHVLQFDPDRRSQDFPNGTTVFQYLDAILKKKIVSICSVHKLELYSYEINDSTLLGTLKDWISRDIKVPKTDLILLFNNSIFFNNDSSFVTSLLGQSNLVCMFKKGTFISDSINYNFPKLLRELFNNSQMNLNGPLLRQLYGQTIFYITCELKCINSLKTSFRSYFTCINNLCNRIKSKHSAIGKDNDNLISKIEAFNNVTKNNCCDITLTNLEYKSCVSYLQRLLSSVERSNNSFHVLSIKVSRLMNKEKFLNSLFPEIETIIKGCDIQEQLKRATGLVSTESGQDNKGTYFITNIKNIVSDTIKVKDKLLRNKDFKNYTRYLTLIIIIIIFIGAKKIYKKFYTSQKIAA